MTHERSLTGRRWVWPEPLNNADATLPAPYVAALLERRGFRNPLDLKSFLSPSLANLHDPGTMADMPVACARLARAVTAGERICVYGDYDVDGVSSTAILVDFLQELGAQVDYYIPHRQAEGYGLNAGAIEQLRGRVDLLITCDCGITAVDEIALAKHLGIEVIVVDHHQVPAQLPPAHASLNPHRRDCTYPFKDLCAAGVAFLLAVALRRHLRDAGYFSAARPEPDVRRLLDVVAVATVADMVPIRDTNRALVAAGLKVLRQARRPGLAALMQVSDIQPSNITATDLGFRIGPRINARGRVGHAAQAVELLLTKDHTRAQALAAALDAANHERRALEQETVAAAVALVEAQGWQTQPILVLQRPEWHPGVLGLVATRLVSRYHCPALVIGAGGKGSGRSIEGLDLHATLATCAPLMDRFGGHPAAAGLTIRPERVDALRAQLCVEVRRALGEPPFVPVLRPDLELDPEAMSLGLVSELERLQPFGQGNPEPLWVARRLRVGEARVVGDAHLKLRLGAAGFDAIGFGLGNLASTLPPFVDAAFHLERNVYRGRETLQLRLADLRETR